MTRQCHLILLTILIFMSVILQSQDKTPEFPVLKGPYLGQKPPGVTPEIFAPGIVSIVGRAYRESDICFWPDGKRCIFARFGDDIPDFTIFESRVKEGVWTKPEISGALKEGGYLPCVSPDGRKIVYTTVESASRWPIHLYLKQEVDGVWSPPQLICKGMYPSMTLEGTLYYAVGDDVPVFRRYVDGIFQDEELVGKHIYPGYAAPHPFIAPDESYLLYADGELFVSFRTPENTWTEPQDITNYMGIRPVGKPRVTYDRKYLFFTSGGDIYWVDAKVVERMKPKELE